jgi:ATP adenylyltransferase
MARIDRSKRALGGAIKRDKPSKAATIIVKAELAKGRVLDFGCGFGFDADHYSWESYDPFYQPKLPQGPFDTIMCTLVISALSRNNRTKVINNVRELLADDGFAYFAVARDLPRGGKLGINHSLQNYIVLTLPSVFADDTLEIYQMDNHAKFKDKTKDFLSLRDKRRDS